MAAKVKAAVERYAMRIIVSLLLGVVAAVGAAGYAAGGRAVRTEELPARVERTEARLDSVVLAVGELSRNLNARLMADEVDIRMIRDQGSVTAQATWRVLVCHMSVKEATLESCRAMQVPPPSWILSGGRAP